MEKKKICKSEYFAFCVEVKVFCLGNFEKFLAKKVFFLGKLFLCFVVRMLSENYIFVNEKGCEKRGEMMQLVKISTDTDEKPRTLR